VSNPQKEHGYTAIANEIMEALARIRISGEARQVLDVIFRKTYGFNKKEDSIALSQFVLKTGLKKPSVSRALSKLDKMNIINKKVNEKGNIYRFNKQYDTWKPLTKKIIVNKKVNKRLQKSKSPLTKKLHTKETITKETITKERVLTPLQEFIQFYRKEFNNRFGWEPIVTWGKYGKLYKEPIKQYGLDKLKELLITFFDTNDEFYRKAGYTLDVFHSQINKLITSKAKVDPVKQKLIERGEL
jgi:phage replication O-like protein O